MAAFKNDGSFLEMFQKMQQEQAAKAAADQAKQVAAKVLAEAQSRSAAAKTESTSQGPTPGTSNVKIPMSRPTIKPAGLGLGILDQSTAGRITCY
jgi:regulator of protease activity HflC (stomatin/prohibitin superfamily)